MLRQLATGNYLFSDKDSLYVITESVAKNINDFMHNITKYLKAGKAVRVTNESMQKLNNLTKDITSLG